MYKNQPILSYYPKDDSKFLDPMYIPYQNSYVSISGEGCFTPVNGWKRSPCSEMVSPSRQRIGWYMDFARIHPNDACPQGWIDVGNGFCSRAYESSQESTFATPQQFAAEYQYPDGYTIDPKDYRSIDVLKKMDVPHSQPFVTRSVNPNTGNYVVYFEPRTSRTTRVYGREPSKFSYLGL